jgi:hypothetical protein
MLTTRPVIWMRGFAVAPAQLLTGCRGVSSWPRPCRSILVVASLIAGLGWMLGGFIVESQDEQMRRHITRPTPRP